MTSRITLLAASLFWATQALAHRPYGVAAGSFTRSDGVTISAVEYYVDGILGTDPVSVQFRLPDGSVMAQTEPTRDRIVVRHTPLGFEVYRFPSDWFPIADQVQRFDGFSLTHTTLRPAILSSVLVHTRAHSRDYAVVLVLVGILAGCWFAVRAVPKRGWLAVVRSAGLVTIVLASYLAAFLVIFAFPVSPFIVGALSGLPVAIGMSIRSYLRRPRSKPCHLIP